MSAINSNTFRVEIFQRFLNNKFFQYSVKPYLTNFYTYKNISFYFFLKNELRKQKIKFVKYFHVYKPKNKLLILNLSVYNKFFFTKIPTSFLNFFVIRRKLFMNYGTFFIVNAKQYLNFYFLTKKKKIRKLVQFIMLKRIKFKRNRYTYFRNLSYIHRSIFLSKFLKKLRNSLYYFKTLLIFFRKFLYFFLSKFLLKYLYIYVFLRINECTMNFNLLKFLFIFFFIFSIKKNKLKSYSKFFNFKHKYLFVKKISITKKLKENDNFKLKQNFLFSKKIFIINYFINKIYFFFKEFQYLKLFNIYFNLKRKFSLYFSTNIIIKFNLFNISLKYLKFFPKADKRLYNIEREEMFYGLFKYFEYYTEDFNNFYFLNNKQLFKVLTVYNFLIIKFCSIPENKIVLLNLREKLKLYPYIKSFKKNFNNFKKFNNLLQHGLHKRFLHYVYYKNQFFMKRNILLFMYSVYFNDVGLCCYVIRKSLRWLRFVKHARKFAIRLQTLFLAVFKLFKIENILAIKLIIKGFRTPRKLRTKKLTIYVRNFFGFATKKTLISYANGLQRTKFGSVQTHLWFKLAAL